MTTRRPILVAFALALAALAAGCGYDNITENEAGDGWRTASQPLFEGQQAIQKKAEENTDKLIEGETITHVVDCDDSGDVKFALSVDLDPDMGDGPKVDLTADYRGCEADRIETDGKLAIDSPEFSSMASGGGSDSCDCPEPTPIDYEGNLDWSGKVDGPCKVDMTAEIPPWGRPTYSGDMCGYEASEVLGGF